MPSTSCDTLQGGVYQRETPARSGLASLLVAARRRTSENQAPKAETFGFLLQLRARRPKGPFSVPPETGIPHVPRPMVQSAPIPLPPPGLGRAAQWNTTTRS